ncbi:hypothetical protein B0A48_12392 [Cryoendolithus antarcticus]|uniref:Uncharacterized protein n=1 Tax=Cryoendolithus antarcticus TaxID=1507870 RepID=A0A1V8SS80_9PEZI|nr:hypothetical protein B0A48_12392 [Cryoendolithus antarcticus]
MAKAASYRHVVTGPAPEVSTLPPNMECAAALEYVGLRPDFAEEIYTRWCYARRRIDNADSLFDYVKTPRLYVPELQRRGFSDSVVLDKIGLTSCTGCRVDTFRIQTHEGYDWYSPGATLCTTPNRRVAEGVQMYARSRVPFGESLIVKTELPDTFFAELQQSGDLDPGLSIRAKCPRCDFSSSTDPDLSHKIARAELLIGSMHADRYEALSAVDPELAQDRLDDDTFTIQTGKTLQWLILNDKATVSLQAQLRAKHGAIHVDVYAPTRPDRPRL